MGEGNDGKQYLFYLLYFLGTNLGFAFWYDDREDRKGDRQQFGDFYGSGYKIMEVRAIKIHENKGESSTRITLKKEWKIS